MFSDVDKAKAQGRRHMLSSFALRPGLFHGGGLALRVAPPLLLAPPPRPLWCSCGRHPVCPRALLLDDLREKLTAAGPTGKVSLKNYLTDKEQVALRTVLGARNPSGALRGKVEALVDKLEPHVELLRQRAASR